MSPRFSLSSSGRDDEDANPLLPQHSSTGEHEPKTPSEHIDDVDLNDAGGEGEEEQRPRTRRPKWTAPQNRKLIVAAGVLLALPILCLFSPLFNFNTLSARDHQTVHAPTPSFTLTLALPKAGAPLSDGLRYAPTADGREGLFPTGEGHAGPMRTGAEAGIVQTAGAFPLVTAVPGLVRPVAKDARDADEFEVFRHLGPLSPYLSSPPYLPTTPLAPDTCSITGVHMLHRHGARYPTTGAPPGEFAKRLHAAVQRGFNASDSRGRRVGFRGELAFLNEWTYDLGEEILTPSGRQQLLDSGASFRNKYGYLLRDFAKKPVFRTTTQHRMHQSAIHWSAGFFGVDAWAERMHLSLLHEWKDFNNTLAPYDACDRPEAYRGSRNAQRWRATYLSRAVDRLNVLSDNFEFGVEDAHALQDLCAYETVALGYSRFCGLFTQKEWAGYGHAWDIAFHGDSGFGSPVGKAQGVGYIQELLARLTSTPIAVHNSSTNATLDDDSRTFPLDQPIYVDFSHDTVLANVVTALNLTQFSEPPPIHKLPVDSALSTRWRTSHIAPFAGNIVIQLLSCSGGSSNRPMKGDHVRVLLNDAVVSLESLGSCAFSADGLCARADFESGLGRMVREVDFAGDCKSGWELGDEVPVRDGRPPSMREKRED